MGSEPSRAAVRDAPGAGATSAEHGFAEAKRKLDVGRERVGSAAAERVDEMRDEADTLARLARKRARRIRKCVRKRLRAAHLGWRIGTIVGAGTAAVAIVATLRRGQLTRSGALVRKRASGAIKKLSGGRG